MNEIDEPQIHHFQDGLCTVCRAPAPRGVKGVARAAIIADATNGKSGAVVFSDRPLAERFIEQRDLGGSLVVVQYASAARATAFLLALRAHGDRYVVADPERHRCLALPIERVLRAIRRGGP